MQISKVHHTFQVTQEQIHANLKSTNISSHKSTKTWKSQKYIIHFKSHKYKYMQISKVHQTFQVTKVQRHANLKSTSYISSHTSTNTCKSQKYIKHFKSQVPRHAKLKGTSYISSHKYKDMQISQEHHIDNSQVYIQASSIVYFQLVYIRLWCTSLLLKPCTCENLCVYIRFWW